MLVATLSACAKTDNIQPHQPIEVRYVETRLPAPIVPKVDQLNLRDVSWMIVTPENAEAKFAQLPGRKVLFALSADGYKNISMNLSDIRANVEQQKRVIALYERHHSK
jgi:predicted RNA-binding protein associated with RNAse of E/G family